MSTLDLLNVFSDEVYSATTELQDINVNAFNAASGGALTLIGGAANQGDFTKQSYYKKVSGLVRRRDPYDRASSVNAVNIENLLDVAVKVAGGTPPVNIDPDTLAWIQRKPTEYAQVLGAQLAEDMLADELDVALVALIASMRSLDNGDGTVIYDATNGTDTGTLTLRNLNSAAKLFGDRAAALRTWVIQSTPMHDLFDEALTNTSQLFQFGNVQVMQDGFGRRFVMTDSPALTNSGSPEGFNTLGLVDGACAIEQNNDFFANTELSNGKESIAATYQAQWSYNAGVKGSAWNTSVKAPTDAELATEGNWTQIASSIKDTAGVMVISD